MVGQTVIYHFFHSITRAYLIIIKIRVRIFLKAAQKLPEIVKLQQSKYLNNIIEQDYTWLKRLVKTGIGFRSFNRQGRTIKGYKTLNMMDEKRTSFGSSQGSHQRADYLPQPHFRSSSIE